MTDLRSCRVLTINAGSSSLKAALYRTEEATLVLELRAVAERIGPAGTGLRVADAAGRPIVGRPAGADHGAVVEALLDWMTRAGYAAGLEAVGYRVVHGGPDYAAPRIVDDALLVVLRGLVPIDPEHLPQALAVIDATGRALPDTLPVACFDTAFHRRMPRVAQLYALPHELEDAGILRYGFHGLSYESILDQLRGLGQEAAAGRIVIAHLGNGASMAAVRDGVAVDTTMGFTPTGGLVMGTRAGDLDPGVLLHLLRERGMPTAEVGELVNRRAGLLGVSGTSGDMRDLLAREGVDARAAAAVALFCYQAKKFLGGLVAALGGLDALVFTGGIGEHAAPVRERICAGLGFLGICLDPDRNRAHAPIVSRDGSPVTVRVMRTDEDLVIATHTVRLLKQQGGSRVPV